MKLINRIFFPLILIISIVLLLYVFYKSEIYWDGEKRNFYQVYYFLISIIIIFSIIAFYLSEEIKTYLIIIVISLVFALYFFELYLVYQKNDYIRIYEKETGEVYDTRSKIEVYKELKKKDKKIVVDVSPFNFLKTKSNILPLSGISNSNTIYCNENGYFSLYQSDRYGFNNPDKEWDETKIEFLLVGDSNVHGACINRPHDISSVLRSLSNKPVLNLAYGRNSSLIEYAVLREYLQPNVKNILWFYYEGNDLTELKDELRSKILFKYIENTKFNQNLKNKQNIIDEMGFRLISQKFDAIEKSPIKKQNNSLRNIINFFKIYSSRELISKNFIKFKTKPKKEIFPVSEFKEILKMANELAIKNNSKLYFIYIPEYSRYRNKDYDNNLYLQIKETIQDLEISLIDLHLELFQKTKDPLKFYPFQRSGHFNILGNKSIAKVVYEKIMLD